MTVSVAVELPPTANGFGVIVMAAAVAAVTVTVTGGLWEKTSCTIN
jgi:hypothetical protein